MECSHLVQLLIHLVYVLIVRNQLPHNAPVCQRKDLSVLIRDERARAVVGGNGGTQSLIGSLPR